MNSFLRSRFESFNCCLIRKKACALTPMLQSTAFPLRSEFWSITCALIPMFLSTTCSFNPLFMSTTRALIPECLSTMFELTPRDCGSNPFSLCHKKKLPNGEISSNNNVMCQLTSAINT